MPEIKIRNKIVKFRKWKVKDRNKFVKNLDNAAIIKDALVYDCLETPIVLTEDEYKFVLMHIRAASLPNNIEYTFECSVCEKPYDITADLSEIVTGDFKPYSPLKAGDVTIIVHDVRNKDFYNEQMSLAESLDEKHLIDFILHVQSYNTNDCLSFQELAENINELDVDVFESLMKQWEEMRFKFNNTAPIQCPHCENIEIYEFDELPNFFPDSWTDD